MPRSRTQYTSIGFGLRCKEAGVRPSMGSVGDCFDNAMCESFFATLECELLDRRRFPTKRNFGRNQAWLPRYAYMDDKKFDGRSYYNPGSWTRYVDALTA